MVQAPQYRTAVWNTYEEMNSWRGIDIETCELIGAPRGSLIDIIEGIIREDFFGDPNARIPDTIDFADDDNIKEWEAILGDYYGSELLDRVFERVPGAFVVWGREYDDSDYIVACIVRAGSTCDRTHLDSVINRGAPS